MAKNNKRRCFTLVELIVVLVILAILAALLIPALTGYIDKAKKNQVIAETRMLTQAAQTELSSLYATDEFAAQNAYSSFTVASRDGSALPLMVSDKQLLTNLEERYDEIVNLSEVPSLKSGGKGYFFIIADHSAKIQFTVYNDGKSYYGIYCEEDGSLTAYRNNEVPYYDDMRSYDGKIVCTNIYDTDGRKYWSKAIMFGILGIAQ
jgi:prepilin-type N-terminal cleavage/methylation domain-containing protein